MAQEFFCIIEENDFNIHVVQDPNSIHDGQCPVPPVLDHQLDVLMIMAMVKMKTEIFEKLKKMIKTHSRSHWFEAYLTVFILLSNLQYVYRSQERWWKMHYNTVCSWELMGHDHRLTLSRAKETSLVKHTGLFRTGSWNGISTQPKIFCVTFDTA
jgi:hypothetical protein